MYETGNEINGGGWTGKGTRAGNFGAVYFQKVPSETL